MEVLANLWRVEDGGGEELTTDLMQDTTAPMLAVLEKCGWE